MNIGIIGTGNVGGTLGTRWAQSGHKVYFGVRNPTDPTNEALKSKGGPNVSVVTPSEAASASDVVTIALPYGALQSVIEGLGNVLEGKVILDCSNPINADFSGVASKGRSAAEEIAAWAHSNKVVKIFNTVGYNIMENPNFDGRAALMLYCGDDEEAKTIAAGLASELGFDPQDAGALSQAHWLESFAWLWISMALKYGHGREMAFKLMKR